MNKNQTGTGNRNQVGYSDREFYRDQEWKRSWTGNSEQIDNRLQRWNRCQTVKSVKCLEVLRIKYL